MMSIANKMRVLEMLDNSGTKTLVECFFFFDVNESTVCTIKKHQKGIRASVLRGTPELLRKSHITQNAKIVKMEGDFHLWFLKQRKLNMPLCACIISSEHQKMQV